MQGTGYILGGVAGAAWPRPVLHTRSVNAFFYCTLVIAVVRGLSSMDGDVQPSIARDRCQVGTSPIEWR